MADVADRVDAAFVERVRENMRKAVERRNGAPLREPTPPRGTRGPAPVAARRILELIGQGWTKNAAIASAAGCTVHYVSMVRRQAGLPAPARGLSPEARADVLARIRAGESYRAIAAIHATTFQNVGWIAKRHGIRRYVPDRFDDQIREGNAAGLVTRVLARAIGTTQSKIVERQRQLGLDPVGRRRAA